jgi:hypothetical protein
LSRRLEPPYDGIRAIAPDAVGAPMALWEISFRTQYDYPFIQMSQRYPGLPISMWCIFNRELLQVPTLDETKLASI